MTNMPLVQAIHRVRASRDRGVRWILDHIGSDGEPVGARERNAWARAPWALAVCGESEAAAAVIAWADRGQLTTQGFFTPGPAAGTGRFPAYPLAHLAIGAWLAERTEISLRIMSALRGLQDHFGGLPIALPGKEGADTSDLLSTAQVGHAALITGQADVAEAAFRWVRDLIARQPADAGSRFYSFCRGGQILVEPSAPLAWLSITDFARPRQSFYTPGMAAVFLSAYGAARALPDAGRVARSLLQKNIEGCSEQFTDNQSVQICKFGWGAATVYVADEASDLLPWVARKADWFIEHQAEDGSWSPSTFLVEAPTDIDRLLKTSEHVMEVNAILAALGTARGHGASL